MITTIEALRGFLAVKVMGWTKHTDWGTSFCYCSGHHVHYHSNDWRPDLSRDQFAEVWGKLDGTARFCVSDIFQGGKLTPSQFARGFLSALDASPLTLCIAVARALGETVKLQEATSG